MKHLSWGEYPKLKPSLIWPLDWHGQTILFNESHKKFLAYGQGKSYGDSCLNESGVLLTTSALNRLLFFDTQKGILRCEAGITFADILSVITQQGWFLPVVPGTQYISLGGALANDIHGKNHHQAGTFGCHVLRFELLRSNGERYICSPLQHTDLYHASIGGLGLTGLITCVEIQLMPIKSFFLETEQIKFYHLEQFLELQKASENQFEYTVAWLDCLSDSKAFGRGIFMRANHTQQTLASTPKRRNLSIPFYFPSMALNRFTMKAFNHFYFNKQKEDNTQALVHYQNFFFPLDSIKNWNKIYGRKGFLQYQCVVSDIEVIKSLLKVIARSKQGSFLSVLKAFADKPSPGLLSFPQPGMSLALDFPIRGQKTFSLLDELDHIVIANGGRVYPAKDARMSSAAFKQYFPQWQTLLAFKDPCFNSHFWQRLTGE